MKLYESKLTLCVPNFGLRVDCGGFYTPDIIKALKPHLTDSSILSVLMSDENYEFESGQFISSEIRWILDCIGYNWVSTNKISAIKLVRKLTEADLKTSKDAVEEYLA